MFLSNFLKNPYFSKCYDYYSAFKRDVFHCVNCRATTHKIFKISNQHLDLMGDADGVLHKTPMMEENYFGSWAKIFTHRPVLPFDHHPHAWTMA
jgi:hypothetical protein